MDTGGAVGGDSDQVRSLD